ncbi:hypothetical protein M413DRAFT_249092 [Hebeloma cylindrosporum]|uniref:Uncharacterized protein n=1 Tax=Hebeloma cylindrosporum TaxID=76867 RepID=A0A0C3BNP2_HEBCY|nr:hypothetical protein M413DRAFT_249092 [Hebeloma cylindrosporum h7]
MLAFFFLVPGPCASDLYVLAEPRLAIKTRSVNNCFDKTEGPSRTQYLLPSPPSHITSSFLDRIAFKMDLEELRARMNETRMDHESDESASRSLLGDKPEHEHELSESFPRPSSSDDVMTRGQPRRKPYSSPEAPPRRPEEGLSISSSSSARKVTRHSRPPKNHDWPITCSSDGDSTLASSSSSRRDAVDGRLSSARSGRRTTGRGIRSGLPSRRGCLL